MISATETWQIPFIPELSGREYFQGKQLHSGQYQNPKAFDVEKTPISKARVSALKETSVV
ncbi:hypothetical protein U3A58_18050 [Algoriphagus sp. C2-6-M1]|uniref:hypothetical protein n=1 Tax=Algoriphagus persicinus TaxID=3108754 RepID=UPI002B3A3BFE|nr:hypothetical protein [Algoriphagus sp. C2-6-M1]MEB2782298.1 hypothetical protein [Algoriphagus sp. C2-6-M1]